MPLLTLEAGFTVTLEAIDPATGATVTGVTLSNVSILATNIVPGDVSGPSEPLPDAPIAFTFPIGSEVIG